MKMKHELFYSKKIHVCNSNHLIIGMNCKLNFEDPDFFCGILF